MDVYVVDAVRTPFRRRNDALRGWHPVDLSAEVLKALASRLSIENTNEMQVYLGCAMPIGEQAGNIARAAVLAAGWDDRAVASTFDAGVAAGHLAVHAGIHAIASGDIDMCIAGGVESTSRVPLGATTGPGLGKPFGQTVHDRYAELGGLAQPGAVAERIAQHHGLDRTALDFYAERSISRAKETQATDTTKTELIAIRSRNERGNELSLVESDGVQDVDISSYKSAFTMDGIVTAANFAAPADGASVVALASPKWCERQGVAPLARVVSTASSGANPLNGSTGEEVAFAAVAKVSRSFGDIDIVELHEDSAATPLGFSSATGIAIDAINVHGGALAFGEPQGASGAHVIGHLARSIASETAHTGLAIVAGWSSIAAATMLSLP